MPRKSFPDSLTFNLKVFFFPSMAFVVHFLPIVAQEFEEGHNFCDPNPCEFDGICQSTDNGYVCTCPKGTTGYNCGTNIDDCIDHRYSAKGRHPTKCQTIDANATCVDQLDGYRCVCSDQFFGNNCEISSADWDLIQLFPTGNDSNLIELVQLLLHDPSLFQELTPFFINNGWSAENRTKLSWRLDDLFIWASFAGQELEMDTELVPWNDPSLGNCFTFGQSGKIYDVADIGENYGFQALLRVNEEEYLPWIDGSSINVYVQRRNEHIFHNSLHYSSPPGSQAQMMLTERNVGRLDGVYGECMNGTKEANTFYYPGTYTIIGCLQSCYQNQVHLVCGCTDPRYAGIRNVGVCGLDKAQCVLNVTKVYGDPTTWDSCKCLEACSETNVDTLWYSSDFTRRPAQCWNLTGNDALADCLKSSADEVMLSVFFKFNFVEDYDETPSQTFNQWLLQFGGITGIIAGFCFISIIEFVFFLYRTFLTFCTNEAVTQDTRELQFIDEDDADFDVFTEPIALKSTTSTTATKEAEMRK